MFLRVAAATMAVLCASAWGQEALRLKACGKAPCAPRRTLSTTSIPPRQHLILQFRDHPGAAIRAELAGRGIRILGYVPDSGVMVSASHGADLRGLEVAWAGPLDAADKLSPALAEGSPGPYLVVFHADVEM